MYNKLASLVGHYLVIGTTIGTHNAYYRARLLEISPETFEMELYSPDGTYEGRYIGPTISITSVQADTRELRELSLHIRFNHTEQETGQEILL